MAVSGDFKNTSYREVRKGGRGGGAIRHGETANINMTKYVGKSAKKKNMEIGGVFQAVVDVFEQMKQRNHIYEIMVHKERFKSSSFVLNRRYQIDNPIKKTFFHWTSPSSTMSPRGPQHDH